MKFRIYQLFFVATIALLVLALTETLMTFTSTEGCAVYTMSNFSLTVENEVYSRSVVALGVVLVFAAVVNLFATLVSLYSNFELLKRTTILSMLLLTGYYVLMLIYAFVLSEDSSIDAHLPMLYPFFAMTLNLFSYLFIRKQEAKIVARALGFRLRD